MDTELIKVVVPSVVALIAVLVGVLQYRASKREEFRKRFWEEQYALYSKAVNAAATIAAAHDLDSVQPAREEFWCLYWGSLSMIEDRNVEVAMVNFGKKLCEFEKRGRLLDNPACGAVPTDLRVAAYDLAHSMRESLARTWQPIDLGKLAAFLVQPS